MPARDTEWQRRQAPGRPLLQHPPCAGQATYTNATGARMIPAHTQAGRLLSDTLMPSLHGFSPSWARLSRGVRVNTMQGQCWSSQGQPALFSGFPVSSRHVATAIMQTRTLGSMPLLTNRCATLPVPTKEQPCLYACASSQRKRAGACTSAHRARLSGMRSADQPMACSAPVGLWARAVPGSVVA
jgi:hypothetical protein